MHITGYLYQRGIRTQITSFLYFLMKKYLNEFIAKVNAIVELIKLRLERCVSKADRNVSVHTLEQHFRLFQWITGSVSQLVL